jgi:CPA1 family monovalent cation:H+ antiporter
MASTGDTFILVEEIVVGLLLVAALVGIVTRHYRIPYTSGLVLVGLVLGIFSQLPSMIITPELILALLVPPLVFEAAFHLDFNDLRRDLVLVFVLAVPGVVITTLLVGGVVAWGAQISFTTALVFGAMVAATDPVAVIALFRSIGVPKRLRVLLESESLFNDGTAIVVFNLMVGIALTGSFSLTSSLVNFVVVAGGGLLVGILLGLLSEQLIMRIDDYLIETALTTILAYGSYLVAEHVFHVSGVLAVVAAGLSAGNAGPRGMSPTTRLVVINFWEFAAFLANSFVFLLIGMDVSLQMLLDNGIVLLWAILAILVARAVTIYGLSWVGRGIPRRWQHILYWGGLRGAITLALALSLSSQFANRDQLEAMAFGVVLFTLLVMGLSMEPFVKRMALVQRGEMQIEYERRHARAVAMRAAQDRLQRLYQEGLISDYTWQRLSPLLHQRLQALIEAIRDILNTEPGLQTNELNDAWLEFLRAQRIVLNDLLRGNIISEETYSQLVLEIDIALDDPQKPWGGLLMSGIQNRPPVKRLIAAVVQSQDVENAINALEQVGLSVDKLSSQGGFLGKRNATLLVGLAEGQEELAVKVLEASCRQRVEYVSTPPLEGPSYTMVGPTPVTVGGATIFTFDVEYYEEF